MRRRTSSTLAKGESRFPGWPPWRPPACRRGAASAPSLKLPPALLCLQEFHAFVHGSFFGGKTRASPTARRTHHERRGSLCSGCQKPITGRGITAMAKKSPPSTSPAPLPQAAQQGHLQGAERQALLSELLPQALSASARPPCGPFPRPSHLTAAGTQRSLVPGGGRRGRWRRGQPD